LEQINKKYVKTISYERNLHFQRTVIEACYVLSKYKNQYGGKYNNNRTESNDFIAFTTVKEEKEQKNPKK